MLARRVNWTMVLCVGMLLYSAMTLWLTAPYAPKWVVYLAFPLAMTFLALIFLHEVATWWVRRKEPQQKTTWRTGGW